MAQHESSPVLLPEVKVRARYGASRLRFRLLRPSYPAIGLGTLRVLRVREAADVTEIVAGYEGYERLPAALERPR